MCLWSKPRRRDTHDLVNWTATRLRTLQRQVRPLRASSSHLRELDERITNFLGRSCSRRDEGFTS